ncbi:virB8 family protein [Aureimonas sp. N4]|uniref:virB8 family protein n=1 Tax=Aureimonas sp. N4 TaxID=1638165 RepID=UPI000782DD88|nr:VirB8/TrbF family protein [Aureimonas sp. N4]
MIEQGDLKTYFAEAQRWDQQRLASAMRSKRLAWTVAACACGLAAAAVLGVAALAPLKTVEPFVVRVNENTGFVDIIREITGKETVTYEEAVQRYWLGRYVRARENYSALEQQERFHEVALFSTPAEQERFASEVTPSNPQSPVNQMGRNGRVLIDITSISFLNKEIANVRFLKTTERGKEVARTNWIATIGFAYMAAPTSERDRLVNPLGFQVLSYRADPEVVR